MLDPAALRVRLAGVRDRIARAAIRAGRDPASIRLVAVSKAFSAEHVRAAAEAGQLDFGENKVQEGVRKAADTADLPLRWHLVGHLQSNKARKAALFHAIHSVHDLALLRKIDEAALGLGRVVETFIQVDLASEPTKHGALPEHLAGILSASGECRGARVRGLMVLPPASEDVEATRPYFAALRSLRDGLIAQGADPDTLSELSMGMSHDFEVAIEEGATIVRVGSAIFGERTSV